MIFEMMKKILHSVLLLLFISSVIVAQDNEKEVLAMVGNEEITVDDFKQRYQFIPVLSKDIKGKEEQFKMQFLYTLIAEKLWAKQAEELGFDTTDVIRYSFKALEKMLVRDALYRQEIDDKLELTNETLQDALNKAKYTLKVKYLIADDNENIEEIYENLNSGVSFDSLLMGRPEYNLQQDSILTVRFGELEPALEDSLFALEVGEVTKPVSVLDHWFVFYLQDKAADKMDAKLIRKVLEERERKRVYEKFFSKFFSDKRVNTNGYLFWSFAERVIDVLNERRRELNRASGEKVTLEDGDYVKIENSLGADTLGMVFIEFDDDPITLKQFLREFFFNGFYTLTSNPYEIRGQLQLRVKRYIEREMLAREGYKRGLHKLPEVKRDINVWKENYYGALYKRHIAARAEVNESEVRDYYEGDKGEVLMPQQINIVEVLTDSLEVVERVLQEIKKGTSIRTLASEYTIREETKNREGEFGYFPVSEHKEIGEIASRMELGEVYGPLELSEGYSVFKLIGKKEGLTDNSQPFEEVKDKIKEELEYNRFSEMLVEKTVDLASEYGVQVNLNTLYNTGIKNLNMLVYRYIGFGGRILAVPVTPPFYLWAEKWEKEERDLP